MGRGVVVCAVIVCLQAMTWACSSRVPPDAAPVTQQPDPLPVSPAPVAAAPEPPAAPPVAPAAPPVATAVDPAPPPDGCALIAEPGEPITTVALGDRVDPSNAPHPSNESERLLFRQLYETLVRVDCQGRVASGRWPRRGGSTPTAAPGSSPCGENARFSDGTPVTTAATCARAGRVTAAETSCGPT